MSTLAARAGKDIYSEKPFCLTIAEGRAMVETMKRYGTVWQCGTQRKSVPGYRFVAELVRSGRIGKLATIEASYGGKWEEDGFPTTDPQPDPEVFDYDRWLGQAPWAPYSNVRVRLRRRNWDYSGGAIADMGPHYIEFAQWARGDELNGPVEFEGEGVFHDENGINNIPYPHQVRARYADGVRLLLHPGRSGVRFTGDQGWIELFEGRAGIKASPESVLKDLEVPTNDWQITAPHIRNFLDCIKTRKATISNPEIAQCTHTVVHCANICLRLGRKLRWNPRTERFVGDEEANNMLARTMRAPWRV